MLVMGIAPVRISRNKRSAISIMKSDKLSANNMIIAITPLSGPPTAILG